MEEVNATAKNSTTTRMRRRRCRSRGFKNNEKEETVSMVTDMLQERSMESVYEITHWFEKKSKRIMSYPNSVGNSGIGQEAGCEAGEGHPRVSGRCSDVSTGEMVRGCGGRSAARRTVAD